MYTTTHKHFYKHTYPDTFANMYSNTCTNMCADTCAEAGCRTQTQARTNAPTRRRRMPRKTHARKCNEQRVSENAFTGFRFLHELLKWPLDSIILLGRSIGCGPAISLAVQYPVSGVIFVSSMLSVKETHVYVTMCACACHWSAAGGREAPMDPLRGSFHLFPSLHALLLVLGGKTGGVHFPTRTFRFSVTEVLLVAVKRPKLCRRDYKEQVDQNLKWPPRKLQPDPGGSKAILAEVLARWLKCCVGPFVSLTLLSMIKVNILKRGQSRVETKSQKVTSGNHSTRT